MKRVPRSNSRKKPAVAKNKGSDEDAPKRKRIMRAATRISARDGKRLRYWKRAQAEYSGEDGDECDLLRLPDEVIYHIMSYMDNPHVLAMTCQRMHDTFSMLKRLPSLPQYGFNPFACLPAAVRRQQPKTTFFVGLDGLSLYELSRGTDYHFMASVYGKQEFGFVGDFSYHYMPSHNNWSLCFPHLFEMNGWQYFVIHQSTSLDTPSGLIRFSAERKVLEPVFGSPNVYDRFLGPAGGDRVFCLHPQGMKMVRVNEDFDVIESVWVHNWRSLNTFSPYHNYMGAHRRPERFSVARDGSCVAILHVHSVPPRHRIMLLHADGKRFKLLAPYCFRLPLVFTWEWSLYQGVGTDPRGKLTLAEHGEDKAQHLPIEVKEDRPVVRAPLAVSECPLINADYRGRHITTGDFWVCDTRGLLFVNVYNDYDRPRGIYMGAYNQQTKRVVLFRHVADDPCAIEDLKAFSGGFCVRPRGSQARTLFYY